MSLYCPTVRTVMTLQQQCGSRDKRSNTAMGSVSQSCPGSPKLVYISLVTFSGEEEKLLAKNWSTWSWGRDGEEATLTQSHHSRHVSSQIIWPLTQWPEDSRGWRGQGRPERRRGSCAGCSSSRSSAHPTAGHSRGPAGPPDAPSHTHVYPDYSVDVLSKRTVTTVFLMICSTSLGRLGSSWFAKAWSCSCLMNA